MVLNKVGETETEIEVNGTLEHTNADQSENTRYVVTTDSVIEYSNKSEYIADSTEIKNTDVSNARAELSFGNYELVEWEYNIDVTGGSDSHSCEYGMFVREPNPPEGPFGSVETNDQGGNLIDGNATLVNPSFTRDTEWGGSFHIQPFAQITTKSTYTDDSFIRVTAYSSKSIVTSVTGVSETLI